MKSSLKKLQKLAAVHHRDDLKEKRRRDSLAQVDELEQASQDMLDMKDCYDNLLSAAAATTNSAYEFSEALKELGFCLLQKTALNDDEESGRVLLMIGKVQFELQKLVDNYRANISRTITTPSESLLNELRTVEDMKRNCDEKREILDSVLAAHKEKSKLKNLKGRPGLSQQLKEAQVNYEEEASLFVFRLKSLKQGQSRSLLTQATRHHAAQLNFFRKGSRALEAVEPHAKLIAEQKCIDYQFSDLEDDESEDVDDYSYTNDDSELSFDYEQTGHGPKVDSASQISMELDQRDNSFTPVLNSETIKLNERDNSFTPVLNSETIKEYMDKKQPPRFSFNRLPRPGSYSAPIYPDKKMGHTEKMKEFQHSRIHSYVLPTPSDSKSSKLVASDEVSVIRLASSGLDPRQMWHSSPLQPDKNITSSGGKQTSVSAFSSGRQSVLKENKEPTQIPPPLSELLSLPRFTSDVNPNTKKIKRQAFSGPLTNKAWSSKPRFSTPLPEYPSISPTVSMHGSTCQPSYRKPILGSSLPPAPSPKISELHELPRPPSPSSRSTRPSGLIGYSAPLVSRSPENSTMRKLRSVSPLKASPLPTPPGTIARSFSIPSSSPKPDLSAASRLSEVHSSDVTRGIASPALSPISLIRSKPISRTELDIDNARRR